MRACHAADRTGHMILQTLYQQCIKQGVTFFDEFHVLDLIMADGECRGVVAIEVATGKLHVFHGKMDHRVTFPQVIGHEMSGTITAIGDGVSGWATGDRVTVRPLDPCGACPAVLPRWPRGGMRGWPRASDWGNGASAGTAAHSANRAAVYCGDAARRNARVALCERLG